MEHYLHLAREAWTRSRDEAVPLHMMRKVVGIGVRCFENHGVPDRYSAVDSTTLGPRVNQMFKELIEENH